LSRAAWNVGLVNSNQQYSTDPITLALSLSFFIVSPLSDGNDSKGNAFVRILGEQMNLVSVKRPAPIGKLPYPPVSPSPLRLQTSGDHRERAG
jgi:hypothetical protein